MTSVALITAVTLSPLFRPISSALRLVMTDSTTLAPTLTVMSAVTVPSTTSVISPLRWLRALSGISISPHSTISRSAATSERNSGGQDNVVVVVAMKRRCDLVARAERQADSIVNRDATDQESRRQKEHLMSGFGAVRLPGVIGLELGPEIFEQAILERGVPRQRHSETIQSAAWK